MIANFTPQHAEIIADRLAEGGKQLLAGLPRVQLMEGIAELQGTRDFYVELAREIRGIPLYEDIGGTVFLTIDGEIWAHSDDEQRFAIVEDQSCINYALFRAAKFIPEFSELIPRRPAASIDCPMCNGNGFVAVGNGRFDCGRCGGLGWLRDDPAGGSGASSR